MARRLGWSEDVLAGLAEFENLPLEASEKAALRFAERMTLDANGVDDGLFAALRAHFDEGGVIEIAAVIGVFNYFNRFNNVLRIEPTRPGER